MKVKITDDHIRYGQRGNCKKCPIAIALTEMGYDVRVLHSYVEFFDKHGFTEVPLPRIAQDFIERFDSYENPAPFEFDLELSTDDQKRLRHEAIV